jgi:hypothetical protein
MDTSTSLRGADRTKSNRRVAGRTRALPSARAAVGALLCIGAALLTFFAYSNATKSPTTSYLVATRDLLPNVPITANDVRSVTVELPAEQAALAVRDVSFLSEAHLRNPIKKGEFFVVGNVDQSAPVATQEMSFVIERGFAAGGRVQAGERIQIIASGLANTQGAVELANDVRVVNVSRTDPTANSGPLVITIAIDATFNKTAFAEATHSGKLSVVRGSTLRPDSSVTSSTPDPAAPSPKASNSDGAPSAPTSAPSPAGGS